MKLTNPKNGEAFESKFTTHAKAHNALHKRLEKGEFASTFATNIFLSTAQLPSGRQMGSDAQLYWLHKLAQEGVSTPKSNKKVNVTPIVDMFTKASKAGLKHPALVLRTSGGVDVRLSVAGPNSKHAGALYVASPAFRGPYYGRIVDGDFFPAKDYTEDVGELLDNLSKDPAGFTAAQGHLTGRCCFCRKPLDNAKSVSLGYGPSCAKKFGLTRTVSELPALPTRAKAKAKDKPAPSVKRVIRRVID